MRALFTSQPGLGHVLPLTPVARALAEAGHDVDARDARWLAERIS